MLKRVGQESACGEAVSVRQASFPKLFGDGLEYSCPARGTWNIVHTGMLIPEAHQIFVCAMGCLRGVVLTAAEMGAMNRYSSILIREENVLDGSMEELMIEGVADVLKKLSYQPKAVLLFISCQHFFLAYDREGVFETLKNRFRDIRFLDCYMIPTLRKSGLTPDQKMRMQLFRLLEPCGKDSKKINLLGSNQPLSPTCELRRILSDGGYKLCQLNDCEQFEDYLALGEAALNLCYEGMALPAMKDLKERIGQDYLYLGFSYNGDEIEQGYQNLCTRLGMKPPQLSRDRRRAECALQEASELIGETAVAVDMSFTFRTLSFVRMLLEHGFRVTEIFADAFVEEDRADFVWLKEHYPDIMICPCSRPQMRVQARQREEKVLAVGQKAAYFTGTDYFVDVAESGGLYGYDGIYQIAQLMKEAYRTPKDRRKLVQRKGYGCPSCVLM